MSWLDELERELHARRVPPGARRRILAEYADHLACAAETGDADPKHLGDPARLAASFADEAAASGALRAAPAAVAALAVTAAAVVGPVLALQATAGSPGIDQGRSTVLALAAVLLVFVAPQLALVSGTLALVRAVRRRRDPAIPAAELALIRRRTAIALIAGGATVTGSALYAVDLAGPLPTWWVALSLGAAGLAGLWLAGASAVLIAAARPAATRPGAAGTLGDDLPPLRRLAERPARLLMLTALAVGGAATVAAGVAESSFVEGLERGLVEVLALAGCFAVVGRRVGVRG